jgi:hypothetical protein
VDVSYHTNSSESSLVWDLVPNVGMGVPLAALRQRWSVESRLSSLEGGMTLTAAPVSTK